MKQSYSKIIGNQKITAIVDVYTGCVDLECKISNILWHYKNQGEDLTNTDRISEMLVQDLEDYINENMDCSIEFIAEHIEEKATEEKKSDNIDLTDITDEEAIPLF